MKLFKGIKFAALIALVMSIAVGCSSAPEKQGEDQVAVAQQAIADAKAANAEAKAAGAAWRDTDELIKAAEDALAAGDTGKAIQLANQARLQAENALKQKREEDARLAAQKAEAEQAAATPTMDSYTVSRGDSLWGISAKSDIYGNPYQWPLIYKANRNKIKDADLIYPGQQLDIERNASAADVDAAINHARTRGAWSLGVVEDSDMAYLSR